MCFCLGLYIKGPCIIIQDSIGVLGHSYVGVAGLCYEPGWICTTEAASDRPFQAFAWDFHEKGEVGGELHESPRS